MDFDNAIKLIWENRKYRTTSENEAVSHLNEEVAESLKAMLRGDKQTAQAKLEDALSCLFIAFKVLNINPEEAVFRQINKMKEKSRRIMHIYSDRVEIRVDNEVRGGWSIWSIDDMKEVEKMAKEFNCEIEIEKEDKSHQLKFEIPKNVRKNKIK